MPLSTAPLAGARIWLSGAVPESEGLTANQEDEIRSFVRTFARRVFATGGHIVHGSHPSLTGILLEEARAFQEQGGRKDCIILGVSRFWSKDANRVPLDNWRLNAVVYETPEATGENAREKSLELLRKWLAAGCDAIVAVGGKWWRPIGSRAGIPIEIQIALDRYIPCFLLGGLAGAASSYVGSNPDVFSKLKNGLDAETNRVLSLNQNVGSLVGQVCDQLERLPLVRGRGSDGLTFRILAIDGGGLKGTFSASALATWEHATGHRIVDHFDLIAGTSTGGIVALGLALGISAKNLLDFYKKRGPVIFPVTRLRSRIPQIARHLFMPKYSQEVLLKELEAAYYGGGAPVVLKNSACRLVIPTYHAVAGASHTFRTPHHPDLTSDADTQAAHAALATSAAPTFFTAAKIANMIAESSYFDGGVWANSPIMAAIIEAVCFLRIPLDRIDVLSVGTTDEPFTLRKQTFSGILGWIWKKRILDLLMNAQQESSLRLAKHLVGSTHLLRVNETTSPGIYKLDGTKEIGELADLGNRAALQVDILNQVKSRFLNGVHVTKWESYP